MYYGLEPLRPIPRRLAALRTNRAVIKTRGSEGVVKQLVEAVGWLWKTTRARDREVDAESENP